MTPPAQPDPASPPATRIDPADRCCFAVEAGARGIGIRLVEHLLGVLPGQDAPHPTTVARWVADVAATAWAVLEVVDHASAPLVQTLAADEVFVEGVLVGVEPDSMTAAGTLFRRADQAACRSSIRNF